MVFALAGDSTTTSFIGPTILHAYAYRVGRRCEARQAAWDFRVWTLAVLPEVRGQKALAAVVAADCSDHLAVARLDPAAGNLAVEHPADEAVEAGDQVAVHRRLGVRVAD